MLTFGLLFFFFFKQKTAYEMRISDWSSDVCSSDLRKVSVLFAANRQMMMAAEAKPLWLHLSRMCGGGTPNGASAMFLLHFPTTAEIGRASCRERVCQYV